MRPRPFGIVVASRMELAMTTQISEVVYIDNERQFMQTGVLEPYLVQRGLLHAFRVPISALWRGFIGTWRIRDDRLYLDALSAEWIETGEPVCVEQLFAGQKSPLVADWFTGELMVQQGRVLRNAHRAYVTYERDLIISINAGHVVGQRIQVNGTAPDWMTAGPGYISGYVKLEP